MNNQVLLIILIILTTLGCRREDKSPELKDPIYIDLLSEKRALGTLIEETNKKIEMGQKDLGKTQARTVERKNAENDLRRELAKLRKYTEIIEYYDIRTKLRYVESRRSYREAFDKKQDWPLPSEYEAYLVNKRLLRASKNWDDRVPRSRMQQEYLNRPAPSPVGNDMENKEK